MEWDGSRDDGRRKKFECVAGGRAGMTDGRWFFTQRMAWIEEMLHIYGFINRDHLVRKFGVSVPTASTDLNVFLKAYPDRMTYNKRSKRFEAVGRWV